jgi:hypothetical protein
MLALTLLLAASLTYAQHKKTETSSAVRAENPLPLMSERDIRDGVVISEAKCRALAIDDRREISDKSVFGRRNGRRETVAEMSLPGRPRSARYFFHLYKGEEVISDERGVKLDSVRDLRDVFVQTSLKRFALFGRGEPLRFVDQQ